MKLKPINLHAAAIIFACLISRRCRELFPFSMHISAEIQVEGFSIRAFRRAILECEIHACSKSCRLSFLHLP